MRLEFCRRIMMCLAVSVAISFAELPFARAAIPSSVLNSGIRRIVVVVLENTNAKQAKAQPYMSSLMAQGAYLSNYRGIAHPSEPNYLALIAGSSMGIKDDSSHSLDGRHLGDLLESKGLNWKLYAEDYPGNCYLADKGNYTRRHNPFLQFSNVLKDQSRCKRHVVNAKEFEKDINSGQLPAYSFYVPNLLNDGHDTSAAYADKWLRKAFASKFQEPKFMAGTLVAVTFDENDGRNDTDGNLVFTVLLGQGIKSGAKSERAYTHVNLLRTFEDILGVGDLGRQDASAQPIDDVWRL